PLRLGPGMTALTYDTAVARVLADGGPVPRLRQRLLAEAVTAVWELPYAPPRRLVVVPPRALDGPGARALAAALGAARTAGWLRPAGLGEVLAGPGSGTDRDQGDPDAAEPAGEAGPPPAPRADPRPEDAAEDPRPEGARQDGRQQDGRQQDGAERDGPELLGPGPGSARPQPAPPRDTRDQGVPSDYPAAPRASELPARGVARAAADQHRLRTLAKVLADPQGTVRSVRAALARAVSTAWRGDAPGARAYGREVAGFLSASMESVRLVPKSRVVVAGEEATIPVTVDNGLQQGLTGVELRVTSNRPERLRPVAAAVPVRASRAVARTVRVGVRAQANGPVRLTARLYTTSDGAPWGEPITFTADVRSVSSGAVAIVVGGVLLIALAAAFRTVRLRRARARAT
ncbi:DUF6049 family protein, partial [Streptomyces sp. B1866]|uniref:DUF6049 family protein n=1 Tax=Streptomyces sp. B1866 TaxID=3075431 RepID=UPI0028917586